MADTLDPRWQVRFAIGPLVGVCAPCLAQPPHHEGVPLHPRVGPTNEFQRVRDGHAKLLAEAKALNVRDLEAVERFTAEGVCGPATREWEARIAESIKPEHTIYLS